MLDLIEIYLQRHNSIRMSSNCSLSTAPNTPEPEPELELLILRLSPRQRSTPSIVSTIIKQSSAYIFTAKLFTCKVLDTSPASVLYSCAQPNCQYITSSPLHRVLSTGNILKHYHSRHKGIATSKAEAKQVSNALNPP
jgi:hypothetical protein